MGSVVNGLMDIWLTPLPRQGGSGTAMPARPALTGAGRWNDPATFNDFRLTRGDLLAMNEAGGPDAGMHNALRTAHDAVGVIGGLLANVGVVLWAASSGDGSFDVKADQARIDQAVATIDSVATSAAFGGRKLLDGTYAVRAGEGVVTVPAFVSGEIGKGVDGGGPAMRSLVSGGVNDLASGRVEAAQKVVANAVRQVSGTQEVIDRVVGKKVAEPVAGEGHGGAAGWVKAAAREMLEDPGMAVVAVANSEPRNVLGLIGG